MTQSEMAAERAAWRERVERRRQEEVANTKPRPPQVKVRLGHLAVGRSKTGKRLDDDMYHPSREAVDMATRRPW